MDIKTSKFQSTAFIFMVKEINSLLNVRLNLHYLHLVKVIHHLSLLFMMKVTKFLVHTKIQSAQILSMILCHYNINTDSDTNQLNQSKNQNRLALTLSSDLVYE